ncbi:MAG TPA: serine hydrolase domain-containing protein [Alphaproteobacteria bacterium]|nr:serine hydrolase domain-containing protein [Alphaproteobacteria bacterium]
MNPFIYTFLILTTFTVPVFAGPIVEKIKTSAITQKIHSLCIAGKIPGLAVAVVDAQGQVFEILYGLEKTDEQTRPLTNESVFRLASMSKLVTGVLAVVLEDKGLISLNDKVYTHLNDFELSHHERTKNTTLLHLLSHTVGFSRHTYTDLIECGLSLKEIQPRLKNVKLIAEPGQMHAYQNVSFSLIHPYLENKLHKNLEDIYEQYLFKPFGMKTSSLGVGGYELSSKTACPHVRGARGYVASSNNPFYDEVIPAAGVNSSLKDMTNFIKILLGLNPEIFSTLAKQRLFEPFANSPDETTRYKRWNPHVKKSSYGVGMRHYDYEGHKVCGHAGWLRGFSNRLYILPDEKIGIVVLCNSESRVPDYVWTTIAHAIWSIESPYEAYLTALKQPKPAVAKTKAIASKNQKAVKRSGKNLDGILATATVRKRKAPLKKKV